MAEGVSKAQANDPVDLWTVGYEGRDVRDLVRLLRKRGVRSLVDVRELPLSRRAGFSKSKLATALASEGIRYVHLRALGSPRKLRHEYKNGGSRTVFMAKYSAHLSEQADALGALSNMVAAEKLALLCVEKDFRSCHRSVIGRRMAARGLRVGHL